MSWNLNEDIAYQLSDQEWVIDPLACKNPHDSSHSLQSSAQLSTPHTYTGRHHKNYSIPCFTAPTHTATADPVPQRKIRNVWIKQFGTRWNELYSASAAAEDRFDMRPSWTDDLLRPVCANQQPKQANENNINQALTSTHGQTSSKKTLVRI